MDCPGDSLAPFRAKLSLKKHTSDWVPQIDPSMPLKAGAAVRNQIQCGSAEYVWAHDELIRILNPFF